jgi:hypothetical protein
MDVAKNINEYIRIIMMFISAVLFFNNFDDLHNFKIMAIDKGIVNKMIGLNGISADNLPDNGISDIIFTQYSPISMLNTMMTTIIRKYKALIRLFFLFEVRFINITRTRVLRKS